MLAFSLAIVSNLLTFVYYFFIVSFNAKPILLTLNQLLTSASQYLFTFICCQKSCRLLANKEAWLTMLKLTGLVSFILQMVCLLYNSVKERLDSKNESYYSSCATFYWFALNCSQNLILCFFVLVGVYIMRAVHRY